MTTQGVRPLESPPLKGSDPLGGSYSHAAIRSPPEVKVTSLRCTRGTCHKNDPQTAHFHFGAPPDRLYSRLSSGQGHRKADPPALADLVPDGEPAPGLRPRDQAGGRGLQLDE